MTRGIPTRTFSGGGHEGYISWNGEQFYITAARHGSDLDKFFEALALAAAEVVKEWGDRREEAQRSGAD